MSVYEILDKAPLKNFHYKILLLTSLAYGLTGMDVMLIAALVTPIAKEWNLDVVTVGYLLSVGYLGMFIGALFFGRLADVIGRKKVLIMVLLWEAIFTALCGLSSDLTMLYILRFLAGIGLGGALPQPGVYVSEYIPVKHRGLFLGLVETSWVYGALLSLFIPYLILPIFGWRATFFTALAPLALIPLIMLFLPESVRYLLKKGETREIENIIVKMGISSKIDKNWLEKEKANVRKYSLRDLLSTKYARRTILLFILWGGLVYTYHGIFLWLPTIYAKQFNLKDVTSIWWTLVVTLFQIPGYYSASYLLDKIGRKKVLATYLLIAGLASMLLSLIINTTWIFVWSAVISFFNLGAWAGLYAYTPELYPTEIRGTGAGATASFGRLIGIFAPSITGYLFATVGLFGPFTVFSLVHLVAGLSVLALGIETRRRSLEEVSELG
ncbi:MAG: MFS transporter [Thermoproteota archaeon]|jgi:putative MFS transporter